MLEVSDLPSLTRLLTEALPRALGIPSVTLLLWNRRLDSFEAYPPGHGRAPGITGATDEPTARYLILEGQVTETAGGGHDGALVPLMARSGLVGMLLLAPRRAPRARPYPARQARLLSRLASRAALAVENHLYQTELIASERMAALGTLAGMLAHDFRGPMTVIRGYAETLLEPDLPASEVRARAELIMQLVDRLERMTSETLDYAKGDRLARRALPLGELLEELCGGVAAELPGLELVRDFELPPTAEAAFDVDKLRRALGNLAANARDAMGGRGRLHLIARLLPAEKEGSPAGRLFSLTVADEGPGVPPPLADRVFEPFVTQGKKGGTGLGLAVARRFVEDHGGRLELLPKGPGARFRMLLPL